MAINTQKHKKEKIVGIVTVVLVAVIGILLISSRVSSSQGVAPNAPESKAEASDGGTMCNGVKCPPGSSCTKRGCQPQKSQTKANDGGTMCNGVKCCQVCDCINGKCTLSKPGGENKQIIIEEPQKLEVKKSSIKTIVQRIFPQKFNKFRAE